MIAEADANLSRFVPFQNNGANRASAIIFKRSDIHLNNGLVVHRSNLAIAIFPSPNRIADMRMSIEMNALLRRQGKKPIKQRRCTIAACKRIMR